MLSPSPADEYIPVNEQQQQREVGDKVGEPAMSELARGGTVGQPQPLADVSNLQASVDALAAAGSATQQVTPLPGNGGGGGDGGTGCGAGSLPQLVGCELGLGTLSASGQEARVKLTVNVKQQQQQQQQQACVGQVPEIGSSADGNDVPGMLMEEEEDEGDRVVRHVDEMAGDGKRVVGMQSGGGWVARSPAASGPVAAAGGVSPLSLKAALRGGGGGGTPQHSLHRAR
jgi:hypothetical protein